MKAHRSDQRRRERSFKGQEAFASREGSEGPVGRVIPEGKAISEHGLFKRTNTQGIGEGV